MINTEGKTIHPLPEVFEGRGDMSGIKFVKDKESELAVIYRCYGEEYMFYEVFKKKLVPILISFEERLYSETDLKYTYPKTENFGEWAFTYNDYNKAINKFNELSEL